MTPTSPPVRVVLKGTQSSPHLGWAENLPLAIPRGLADALGVTEGQSVRCSDLGAPDARWAAELRRFALWITKKPLSSSLPFSYQRVPSWLRSLAARAIGRCQRRRQEVWGSFPRWPLDLSADILEDLAAPRPAPRRHLVVLSHDLDSREGLRNALRHFLPLEEAVGARSTNYVVPCGWPLDHNGLHELVARGHELGVHGYDHANLSAFLPPELCRERIQKAREALAAYPVAGFRAPSLIRTPRLLRALASFFSYDSSIPTSGGLFPQPNNGCASARPFELEGITELPLSMPRDGTLRFLGYAPDAILALWKACARQIMDSGGIVVLLTHCEARFSGNEEMLACYDALLKWLAAQPGCTFVTAREALGMWKTAQWG